jgi:phage baseplate assembly protein W
MAITTEFTKYGHDISLSVKKGIRSQYRKKTGFAYPVSFKTNKVATDKYLQAQRQANYFTGSQGLELIKNNLRQLLLTEKGERVMMPSFGLSLRKYLFEPLDETTFVMLRQEVLNTLETYFPIVKVVALNIVGGDVNNEHLLKIRLTLKLSDSSLDTFEVDIQVK